MVFLFIKYLIRSKRKYLTQTKKGIYFINIKMFILLYRFIMLNILPIIFDFSFLFLFILVTVFFDALYI